MSLRLSAVAFACSILAVVSSGCDSGVSCTPSCSAGISMCCDDGSGAGVCASILTDRNNCGGCGIACAGACDRGSCTMMPPIDGGMRDVPFVRADTPTGCSGTRMCGDVTVNNCGFTGAENADGRADPSFLNCGTCGRTCDEMSASRCATVGGGSGTPECLCGRFRCVAGELCVLESAEYVCIDTDTDERNCGMVGRACADGETCTGGNCGCGATGMACMAGESCCGGACISTVADDANCGGCGRACAAGTTCTGSMCTCGGDVCALPGAGSLGEICCADTCVAQDVNNCGMCGVHCDVEGGDTCFENMGPLGGGVCCGIELPGFGGFCTGGIPFDAAFPDEDAGTSDVDAGSDAGVSDAGDDVGLDAGK